MNEEAQLLASLWETVQEYVPTASKQETAESMIKTLIDYGNDYRLLRDAEGTCIYLDRAIAALAEDEEEEDLFDEYDEQD